MLKLALVLLGWALSSLQTHRALALENLALRQQLALLCHETPRPRVTRIDRLFWSAFTHVFPEWRGVLAIVQPDTVIRWHREAFRAFWTWRSRPKGRPTTDPKAIVLIQQIAAANPSWGASFSAPCVTFDTHS